MVDLVASNVLRPLDDLAKIHEPAGFRDGMIYSLGDSFDRQTYGFQADGDAYLLFYRKDML
ncbi:MAG: hypothetical protein ABJH45_15580 [Paracoccaceae bacterium]